MIATLLKYRFIRRILGCSPLLQDAISLPWYWKRRIKMGKARLAQQAAHPQLGLEPEEHSNQLLVDVSGSIYRKDHTGVHRVVSGLLKELLSAPPPGYRVRPVCIDRSGQIQYYNSEVHNSRKVSDRIGPPVQVRPGDLYFTADLFYPCPFGILKEYASQGLRIVFTIHDIIPLQYPHYFMRFTRIAFRDWLVGIAESAYGVVCVSRTVADELRLWLIEHNLPHSKPLRIGFFHNGTDFQNQNSVPSDSELQLVQVMCSDKPAFLMVGTLLPYKGHRQVLEAFENLWKAGVDCNLIIIGKEGWRMQSFADQLRRHRELGRRLFWLENANDALLVQCYKSASCLIASSKAEGFGLPLIEAARYGLPILARDIAVFKEIGQGFAQYFQGDSPGALAEAIQDWLAREERGEITGSEGLPWQSWETSKDQILNIVLNDQWYSLCP